MYCKYKDCGDVENRGWCKFTKCRCAEDLGEDCPVYIVTDEKEFEIGFFFGAGLATFVWLFLLYI